MLLLVCFSLVLVAEAAERVENAAAVVDEDDVETAAACRLRSELADDVFLFWRFSIRVAMSPLVALMAPPGVESGTLLTSSNSGICEKKQQEKSQNKTLTHCFGQPTNSIGISTINNNVPVAAAPPPPVCKEQRQLSP